MSESRLKIKRTRVTFEAKFQSQAQGTREFRTRAIDNFENYCMEKHGRANIVDDLKVSDDETVYDTLQDWLNWNKEKLMPSSLYNYWSKVKQYLHYMGIKLHQEDIKLELVFPTILEEALYGLTLKDIQLIFKNIKYKWQVLFTCQSSSLTRLGEMGMIQRKNFITEDENGNLLKNIRLEIPASISKSKRARTTFLSAEASSMIRPMLLKCGEGNPFTKQTNRRNFVSSLEKVLQRALIRAGLDQRYEINGQYKINTHSFRAYGITKLSRIDPNLAKFIAGQKGYLLQYDRLNDDEKLEIYLKCQDDLLIDKDRIQKAEIAKLKDEKADIIRKVVDELNVKYFVKPRN